MPSDIRVRLHTIRHSVDDTFLVARSSHDRFVVCHLSASSINQAGPAAVDHAVADGFVKTTLADKRRARRLINLQS